MAFYAESISSCCRFAERMAEKIPTRPLEANERSRRLRLNREEAALAYQRIKAAVGSGVSVSAACRRHNVSEPGYRAWIWRNGGRK